ncbi:gamma-glutamyl-gamma-aminobutyrate hydrolase family protein, partial [Acinetobacter baumannii]|nr:gamma-glutamyl-gamma-aminobutyrate hydrolase family protein [Acinetobacter baumannii]
RLFGQRFAVNSFHHQAVGNPGPCLRVTARSADGIIEAVESSEMKSIIGVQWHPECFLPEGDESMMPLFR